MNKISTILGPVLVLAIAVVFILQFQAVRPATVKGDSGPQCAVDVRGSCLSKQSYLAAYRLLSARADASRLRSMGFGKKVAEGLLEAWLLDQDAKRLGIGVGDDDVTAEIAAGRAHVSLPASDLRQLGYSLQLGEDGVRQIPVKGPKANKKFDAKYAEKQIRNITLLSPTEFREYQKTELVAARMREIIKSRIRVGENEAFDQFSREKSTVTLDYVRFDRRFFADMLVDLSQRNVDFWADSHKDEIDRTWGSRKAQVLPECRSVREIFVKVDEGASDEEKASLRARIEHARERIILKNEDFSDVARSMSEGATAARGGEIGCLLKGKAPKPLEEAVAALAVGKVSDVIVTDKGFYLVKLDQIAKDADAEKLGRAQTIRELYLTQEAERLAAEASKKVAAAVKGGKSIKDALDLYLSELPKPAEAADKKKDEKKKDEKKKDEKKKEGDKKADEKKADEKPPLTRETHPGRPIVETTLPFNVSGDPIPGVRQSTDLTRIAFGLEKLGDSPGDTITFEGGYLAIQLKDKTPASKELWEKNKEFYLGAMRAAKAHDALVAYIKRLRAQIGADAKFTASIVEEKAAKPGEAPPPVDDDPGE